MSFRSHSDSTPAARAREAARPANLSHTRPPATRADQKIWPAWTHEPLEALGFRLLSEDGTPISAGG